MALEKNLYKNLRVRANKQDIKPLLNKSYRGLSTIDISTKETKLFDLALVRQDILNHFHIRLGEKLERPEFGTIIWDILWEPFTENIKSAVTKNVLDIISSDPRVTVNNVTVTSYEYGIQVECELTYLDYSISEFLRLQFDKDNALN